jgi:hypothetical protein
VFAFSEVRFALTDASVVPEPTDWAVVEVNVERVLEVPHSNHAVAAAPFGFTVPFIVAELVVTELAAVVVTDGEFAPVVKLNIDPFCVPPLFWPAARK